MEVYTMKLIHFDDKHNLKVYYEGENKNKDKMFALEHSGEIVLEHAPAQKTKDLYNSIVNFHHKMERK